MSSPLQKVREQLGLTLSEFSAALGVPYSQLYNAEMGLMGAIPKKARLGLKELGCDTDTLAERQAAWLDERARTQRQAILKDRKRAAVAE